MGIFKRKFEGKFRLQTQRKISQDQLLFEHSRYFIECFSSSKKFPYFQIYIMLLNVENESSALMLSERSNINRLKIFELLTVLDSVGFSSGMKLIWWIKVK